MMAASPSWYRHAVIYQVHPRFFFDSDGDGVGDLRGILARLDHLERLGVDCLWLMPHYPSPWRDDGYDVTDLTAVHPAYGTLGDFRDLAEACHARDIRVLIELVLNHVSDQHPWFQSALAGRDRPFRDFFVWSDTGTEYVDASIIFFDPHEKTSNWTYHAATEQYYWHRFYKEQPDLNYDNPEVRQAILDTAMFWLDQGADALRLDAVPYLYVREGTTCESLPETHDFLRALRRHVTARHPDAVLLCEANQPAAMLRDYVRLDECQLGFDFPFNQALFLALARGSARPLEEHFADRPSLPEGSELVAFLRSHDQVLLDTMEGTRADDIRRAFAPEPSMLMTDGGIRRRLAPMLDDDPRRLELVHALLVALDQPICLYYGDEIAMGEDLARPDRFGLRAPMQWSDEPHGGFSVTSRSALPRSVGAAIDDPVYGFRARNVARARSEPNSLFNRLVSLLRLRHRDAALRTGTLMLVPQANDALLVFERHGSEHRVIAVFNLSARIQPCPLIEGETITQSQDGSRDGLLPWSWKWVRSGLA
ncbi:MAG: alpha-amylase family glycosyl hydrolase [Acidobacteriota bacterium]